MTVHLRWLRGASPAPRYIGIGRRPERLYPLLSYLTGAREVAERLAMHLPRAWRDQGRPPPVVDEAVRVALEAQDAPREALLLYTGYYKETTFVGPVVKADHSSEPVFWKAFSSRTDAAEEVRRALDLRLVLPAGADMAACRSNDAIVEYERLVRSLRPARAADLISCAMDLGCRAAEARGAERVTPAVPLDADIARTFAQTSGAVTAAQMGRICAGLVQCSEVPLYLSHGDFTRWNVFRQRSGRVAVIDYDAVGYRPAYFDVVHLLTQSAVEAGGPPPVARLREVIAQTADVRASEQLSLSLLWDAYETMRQFVHNPENRTRTRASALIKLSAWEASLD